MSCLVSTSRQNPPNEIGARIPTFSPQDFQTVPKTYVTDALRVAIGGSSAVALVPWRHMLYTTRTPQDRRRGLGRATVAFILISLFTSAIVTHGAENSGVRSTNPALLDSISEGAERSATFAVLRDAISRSNGIVYLEFGYCAFGHLNGCLLPFLATSEHTRYLRIVVTPDRTRQSHDQLLALIAHEMQHAREVLEHSEVLDAAAMELLYRQIGTPIAGLHGGFETAAARAVGDAVLNELSRTRRTAMHTSARFH